MSNKNLKNELEDLIIIDWRNIAKAATYSIMSAATECLDPTEDGEIRHRLMQRLLCLRHDHPTARFVLAIDSGPYWRSHWIKDWYAERPELEYVKYKGNRDGTVWPFKTTKERMEEVYKEVLKDARDLLGFESVAIGSFEADDIWGAFATSYEGIVIGYSRDHDWKQCCKPEQVFVHDPITNKRTDETLDMNPYFLGGDRGDNIKGCPKYLKSGAKAKNNWGIDGAIKHVAANPDTWMNISDEDHIEKNRLLMTLPSPELDNQAVLELIEDSLLRGNTIEDSTLKEALWTSYRLSKPAREQLKDENSRFLTIASQRTELQAPLFKVKEATTEQPKREGRRAQTMVLN